MDGLTAVGAPSVGALARGGRVTVGCGGVVATTAVGATGCGEFVAVGAPTVDAIVLGGRVEGGTATVGGWVAVGAPTVGAMVAGGVVALHPASPPANRVTTTANRVKIRLDITPPLNASRAMIGSIALLTIIARQSGRGYDLSHVASWRRRVLVVSFA
jgi:hypothetical protein